MNILKELPCEIEGMIQMLHESGIRPADNLYSIGSRSHIYKIDKYCLKIYTPKGYRDGENEVKALLALRGKCAPELYAYSSGKFILTEWIKGLNLLQYKEKHGQLPINLIYDMYITELDIQKVGFKDWDFKLEENLLWLPSRDTKRIDFGICEPIVASALEHMEETLKSEIQEIYDGELNNIKQMLYLSGLTKNEVNQAISNFLSHSPKLI
ncbi:hypothetical protein [Paenibacillus polymyxa]|uniref:hypothetical protein n=1 Tax=Paenibacillus polymyxa TaxID=1406 RepID=UPI00058A4FBC|nr:hypothetical protein [Paenibacillus polymyxa]AJE54174.1 hypothetical protein RE92_24500 [Paenibacillus polymyxa]